MKYDHFVWHVRPGDTFKRSHDNGARQNMSTLKLKVDSFRGSGF